MRYFYIKRHKSVRGLKRDSQRRERERERERDKERERDV